MMSFFVCLFAFILTIRAAVQPVAKAKFMLCFFMTSGPKISVARMWSEASLRQIHWSLLIAILFGNLNANDTSNHATGGNTIWYRVANDVLLFVSDRILCDSELLLKELGNYI